MLVRASTSFMGVEDQNIVLARPNVSFMEEKKRRCHVLVRSLRGKTQNSLPEFFVPAHIPALLDASLMRVRP